ncbi:MAG: 2-C-methyl-D-erythritol 4-phosphate cytidylyltransferase [Lentimicrobium sp.]|nr:2-C-methyl-D-erythritol 4-phosphate cytidylyltransferase [Lentimicrobium sp.]
MNRYVIIVAGGSGTRMGNQTPKQFLTVGGKPLLMHTIAAFSGFDPDIKIIIVLPEIHIAFWKDLCKAYAFKITHQIVAGGAFRGESVSNGLGLITEEDALVAIHDGVRPFASHKTIETAYKLALASGTAVPVCEINDSVRIVENGVNRPFDRSSIRCIQTPQCFRLSILRKAYKLLNIKDFTDDASLVESLGYTIKLFEGNPENIKITTPFDLIIAEALIKANPKKTPDQFTG